MRPRLETSRERTAVREVSAVGGKLRDHRLPTFFFDALCYPSTVRRAWQSAWVDGRFRWSLFWSVAYALAVLACLRSLLVYVETRPSVELADPLLASFPAIDLSWCIFLLIYGMVVLTVISLLDRPRQFLVTLLAYALLTNLRMLTLYLVPLKEPSSMIFLLDPILESFLGVDFPVCRDLFFSGHTASAFLFCLTAGRRWLRPVLCAATFLTGLFLLLQHVHYTVDIVAAPFFALGSYRLALAILRRRPGSTLDAEMEVVL